MDEERRGPLRKFLEEWQPVFPRKKLIKSHGAIPPTGGAIIEEVTLYGTRGSRVVAALFDTGAEPCVIKPSLADEIGVTEVGIRWVETPFGQEYEIKEVELEKIVIRGKERPKPRAAVATPVGVDFLVGRDVMEWIGVKLEPKKLMMTLSNPGITNRPIELLGGIW